VGLNRTLSYRLSLQVRIYVSRCAVGCCNDHHEGKRDEGYGMDGFELACWSFREKINDASQPCYEGYEGVPEEAGLPTLKKGLSGISIDNLVLFTS